MCLVGVRAVETIKAASKDEQRRAGRCSFVLPETRAWMELEAALWAAGDRTFQVGGSPGVFSTGLCF